MTHFEYKPPALQLAIEARWPDHQNCVRQMLSNHGMENWTVRFIPGNSGSGLIGRYAKIIFLANGSELEMRATFYHEILHWEHPEWTEDTVEKETLAAHPC